MLIANTPTPYALPPYPPIGRSRGFAAARGRITIVRSDGENKVRGRGVERAKREREEKRE